MIKLSEEVKKELIEIKKVEARITMESEKVEIIYSDVRKRFQEMDLFKSDIQEIKVGVEQNSKDIDFIKTKITGLAEKSELDDIISRVQKYTDILKGLEKKSSLTRDLEKLGAILKSIK